MVRVSEIVLTLPASTGAAAASTGDVTGASASMPAGDKITLRFAKIEHANANGTCAAQMIIHGNHQVVIQVMEIATAAIANAAPTANPAARIGDIRTKVKPNAAPVKITSRHSNNGGTSL